LKGFGLALEKRNDSTTDCYTYLRWKKPQEERRDPVVDYRRGMDSVQLFLQSCCVSTVHAVDFVLISDMLPRYEQFCVDNSIGVLDRRHLVGSNECLEFGAKFTDDKSITIVVGCIQQQEYEKRVGEEGGAVAGVTAYPFTSLLKRKWDTKAMEAVRESVCVDTHACTHALMHALMHTLMHALTLSLTHAFTHSCIHSLTHSLT
jgi:hypothetical protein